jgi:S-adenosylmethionine:tRNA ribosyltransferase-isomerase
LTEEATAVSLRLSDFQYELPAALIAQLPEQRREESRMLVLRRSGNSLEDARFKEILDYLAPGDVLVANDSRVIPARLFGKKRGSGASAEIFLLRQLDRSIWKAMVRPGRRLKRGAIVDIGPDASVEILSSSEEGTREVAIHAANGIKGLLERYGVTPLPPYIHRDQDENEAFHRRRYQTVYASPPGSVAAPTAGLHFTDEILNEIRKRHIVFVTITLHVGPGTFRPVKTEDVTRHRMDIEYYSISPHTAAEIEGLRAEGRRLIAVGTTTTRTLEAVARANGGRIVAGSGATDLFIYPGFEFQVIQGLLTNFHLPGSTLLMLVSALAGRERVLAAYRHAVQERYRFYSYGDCMLII